MNLQTLRRELHQIPELGFHEEKTQHFLLNKLEQLRSDRMEIRTWKTGILVKVKGDNPVKTIGYRCDIDALPITEETGCAFQSAHDGRMHASGHDFHMTIALGSLKSILDHPINDDVVFLFQPAGESPDGAQLMRQTEVFHKWKPDVIFALHIAPELPVGTVSSRAGLLFANTSELFLDFKGKGGHAAYPCLKSDMTVAASSFVVELQQIVSRALDPLESAVVTIGKMESGYTQNTIAETARLEGTIRTLRPEAIDVVRQKLGRLIRGFEISHECKIDVDYGSNYYQVYNDKDYEDLLKTAINEADLHYREADPVMTGEGFGYMLKEIPGFMFRLGVDSPYELHSSQLNPDERALITGVKAVVSTINFLALQ